MKRLLLLTIFVCLTLAANAQTAVGAPGSTAPANASYQGGKDESGLLQAVYLDPCKRGAKTSVNINLTASAQLITGTASKKTYICHLNLVSAGADNIAIVEGTGSTCATGIAGMAGGTTAATGWNFAANGGISLGNGDASVLQASNAAADNVCLLVSGVTQVSGSIQYVQF